MQKQTTFKKLSCEQVYNIWASEPELIQLIDLRPKDQFTAAHIPGAIHRSLENIIEQMNSLAGRLAIIIAPEEVEPSLEALLQNHQDFVLMRQCHRWADLNKPMTGELIKSKKMTLNEFSGANMNKDIIFHQLFEAETSTYTYIIADKKTKEAAIIDPVLETVNRDLQLIEELGLRLLYVLDTHIHADHITGAGEIRKRTQAKTAVGSAAEVACVDIPLEDGQELLLGDKKIKVLATPGHTNTCMSFLFEGMIFTGDSLLVRSCGRTDFQQGSSEAMFESIHEKLYVLSDETVLYPGHDYRGQTASTIGLEKKFNARINDKISKDEFKKIMSELKLANPKKIHEAVPANLACGQPRDSRVVHPQLVDGIPEISCEDVLAHMPQVAAKKVRVIDVRRPDEFNAEYGHIEGAELITLGSDLTTFLEKGNRNDEIIFVCRSGGRSGSATTESIKLGYKLTMNMVGGMIRWNENKQPVVRN